MTFFRFSSRPNLFSFVFAFLAIACVARLSPGQGLEPAPDGFKVIEQANSPVRLSVAGVRRMGDEVRTIQFRVENIGQKGIITVLTAGMEKEERNGEATWRSALLPGASSSLMVFSTKHIEGERNVLVEAVLFEDGTVWGANTNGGVDLLKGSWDGRLRLISDLSTLVAANDEASLRAFVENDPMIPVEYRNLEKRTKYDEGFARGYSAEVLGLRSELKERGDVGAISARLAVLKEQMGLSTRGKGKRIAKAFSVNDAFKIERVEVSGRAVALNDEFSADGDWIEDVVVTIRNQSGKRIVSFSLHVTFPETSATGSTLSYPVQYGRQPGLPQGVKVPESPVIEPGESVRLDLGDHYSLMERMAVDTRHSLSQLSRAELGFGMVFFEDGTAWNAGTMMKPDPSAPTRLMPIEKKAN